MAVCANASMVGRDYTIEMYIGCGDVKPDPADYEPIGAFTSKEIGIEWDTVDPTSDASVGAVKETLASYLNFTISGDLVARVADEVGKINQLKLVKHVANPTATGGQPFAWIRATGPDLTYECFMLVSNISLSAPTTDVVTRSFEAAAAASPFGLTVTDTPVVP